MTPKERDKTLNELIMQHECHEFINEAMKLGTNVPYQDLTNTWLFFKLGQLQGQIDELKSREVRK